MALSCQKRLVFVCLAGPLLDLWTGSHIYSPLPRRLQGKWAPFIVANISLLLNPSFICTNLPFGRWCFKVPLALSARSSAEKGSQLSRLWTFFWFASPAKQEGLSNRWDVSSLSLIHKYYYGKCSSEFTDLVPPKHVTVRNTHFSEQMHWHTVNFPILPFKPFSLNASPLELPHTNECFPPAYDLKWPVTPCPVALAL